MEYGIGNLNGNGDHKIVFGVGTESNYKTCPFFLISIHSSFVTPDLDSCVRENERVNGPISLCNSFWGSQRLLKVSGEKLNFSLVFTVIFYFHS